MSGPPSFHPAEGKPDTIRVQRLETWAGGYTAWGAARSEEVGRMILDLHERLSRLEGWKLDVIVFIGGLKIKWGVAMLLAGLVSSILTLGVAKVLHL